MARPAAILLPFLLWVSPAYAQTESSRQLFDQIQPIMEGLSQITGWKVKRQVPADYISKAKLGEFVQKRIKEAVKPEEVRVESLALKMFGFLPEDYDLKKAIGDLMTEQAAAFYDYEHKKLFITEADMSFLEKRAALVHELAHALADQNYSIKKLLHKGNINDDESTAREAVIEGQATWLMWAYVAKLGGGEAKVSEYVLDSMSGAAAAGSEYPVFEKAPLYLRESLVFPYTAGLRFQNAVFERLGKTGFKEVFQRPPISSQQVIHPERYLARQEPTRPEAPKAPEPKQYRGLTEGSVGELDFRLLLEQYVDQAAADRIAPHWRGGTFKLFESKDGHKPLLTFCAEWDGPAAAREFFDAYKTVLGKKWRRLDIQDQSANRASGTGDRGGFVLSLDSTRVTSLEGLPEAR